MKKQKNLTLDEAVIEKIEKYALENGISFSGAVSVLAGQVLQAQKAVDGLDQLKDAMGQLGSLVIAAGGAGGNLSEVGSLGETGSGKKEREKA